jgi:hypothetical protein
VAHHVAHLAQLAGRLGGFDQALCSGDGRRRRLLDEEMRPRCQDLQAHLLVHLRRPHDHRGVRRLLGQHLRGVGVHSGRPEVAGIALRQLELQIADRDELDLSEIGDRRHESGRALPSGADDGQTNPRHAGLLSGS